MNFRLPSVRYTSTISSLLAFTALALPIALPQAVSAEAVNFGHGGLYTSKYVDGANLILLTDNSHGTVSGTPVEYNVRLYDSTGQPIPYEKANISFTKEKKLVYQKEILLSPDNDITWTYTIPRQGKYELEVSFIDHDKEVSKAHFPIVATRGPNQGFWIDAFTIQSGLAFVLGGGVASAYLQRRQLTGRCQTIARRHRQKSK